MANLSLTRTAKLFRKVKGSLYQVQVIIDIADRWDLYCRWIKYLLAVFISILLLRYDLLERGKCMLWVWSWCESSLWWSDSRAGHTRPLPLQPDHVFRPKYCCLLHYGYFRCGYYILIPRSWNVSYFCCQFHWRSKMLSRCRCRVSTAKT